MRFETPQKRTCVMAIDGATMGLDFAFVRAYVPHDTAYICISKYRDHDSRP
jgi:hypothetical protein